MEIQPCGIIIPVKQTFFHCKKNLDKKERCFVINPAFQKIWSGDLLQKKVLSRENRNARSKLTLCHSMEDQEVMETCF